MSHKIYSLENGCDYLLDITFFNGEVRQCNMELLLESMDVSDNTDILQHLADLIIDKSRNSISLPNGKKIESEELWGNSYAIEAGAVTDPIIAFADAVIDLRERRGMSQRELEEKSGVRQAEISKIERGDGNPSLKTMGKLFSAMGQELIFASRRNRSADYPAIMESVARFLNPAKGQGCFTCEDLEDLPDDIRVELIDGIIYDMAVPSLQHQMIIKKLQWEFDKYINNHGGKCMTFSGQTGLWFEDDDENMLIPDMMVICNSDKLKERGIVGVPDFILEVLSPTTRYRDLTIKLNKYRGMGVKEYWIIDPQNSKVIVYNWINTDIPYIYGFEDKIGVGIYDNQLVVDLAIVTG